MKIASIAPFWLLTLAIPLCAQATASAPRLEFDVASILQNKSGPSWAGGDPSVSNIPYTAEPVFRETGGVFSATNWPIYNLVFFAYKTSTGQGDAVIQSLPEWAKAELFNIEARTENRNVTKDEMRAMMRSLLEDRFHIKVHTETREVALYAVTLAKPGTLGPRLRPHPASESCSVMAPPAGKPTPVEPPRPNPVRDDGFPQQCASLVNMPTTAPYHRREGSRDISMSIIAGSFSGLGRLGRPSVDKTGLSGNFDWVIDYLMEPPPGRDLPPDASGPSFREAIKDQLGMKLDATKGPFEFLIVDHIEPPTGN